ncbi:MAG: 4'-phosphopantetheinyl transferase superfamily protein [Malacoplasma sp.]|nr:4'-phosphopantetheinyl transferase superfamily protein [Malacoplasma sp.]MDE6893976.1 4'-phosphopantetheinyl transferase superfamily protein [Malacoplasma sp.]MDE7075512.1 4'-phosphopantetheinyl transferase superfamily protein [Malacoplasma sp.]
MNYKTTKIRNNYAIGIDVTNVQRFIDKKEIFAKRILTKNEYLDYLKTEDYLKPKFLAVRWALKEATYKAISKFNNIFFTNIEFIKMNRHYKCMTFKNVEVSVSYNENLVYAIALFLR